MYCRNLPIIKNKLLSKYVPSIVRMKFSYYLVIIMAVFMLAISLVVKDGFRSIGFILLIIFFLGAFLIEGLDEIIKKDKLTEFGVFRCIKIIWINIGIPYIIFGIIVEIMKS